VNEKYETGIYIRHTEYEPAQKPKIELTQGEQVYHRKIKQVIPGMLVSGDIRSKTYSHNARTQYTHIENNLTLSTKFM